MRLKLATVGGVTVVLLAGAAVLVEAGAVAVLAPEDALPEPLVVLEELSPPEPSPPGPSSFSDSAVRERNDT
jgi:hypothetical protein